MKIRLWITTGLIFICVMMIISLIWMQSISDDYCVSQGWDGGIINGFGFFCHRAVPDPSGLGMTQIYSGTIRIKEVI